MNRLTNSIAVLATISLGGWLAVSGKLSVGFIYTAFTYSFQLAIGFSNLVTTMGAPNKTLSYPRVFTNFKSQRGQECSPTTREGKP